MMLDVDGDGLISLPEMLESIKEAFAAREYASRAAVPCVGTCGLALMWGLWCMWAAAAVTSN